MHASICRPDELSAQEIALWRSFQSPKHGTDSPFLSPEFALAAARWRGDVRVALLEQDNELVGFWAYSLTPRGVAGPVVPGFSDVQGIVHGTNFSARPSDLLKACNLRGWTFDHLVGAEARRLGDGFSYERSGFIDLKEGWNHYLQWNKQVHPKSVSELARRRRKLQRDHGPERFESHLGDGVMLDTVLALKSEQCQRNGWQDPFKSSWTRDLMMDLAHTAAPGLTGVVTVLRAGGRVVAANFDLRSQHVHAGWIVAFDHQYREYSPGALLVERITEEAAATGAREIALGKGLVTWKQRIANGEREVATGTLHRSGLVGAMTTLPNVAEHKLRLFVEHNDGAARAIYRARSARRRLLGSTR